MPMYKVVGVVKSFSPYTPSLASRERGQGRPPKRGVHRRPLTPRTARYPRSPTKPCGLTRASCYLFVCFFQVEINPFATACLFSSLCSGPQNWLDQKRKRRWSLSFDSETTMQGTHQVPERLTAMANITRLVLWLCRKFTRAELQKLIEQLQQVLANREPEIQPRDDFRQKHPHYRDFYVDPQAPFTRPPTVAPRSPPWTGGSSVLNIRKRTADLSLRFAAAVPPRSRPPVVAPIATHHGSSSTSTMVARPNNSSARSAVASLRSLRVIALPRPLSGAPTVTGPSTAGNSTPTAPSTNAPMIAALITFKNNAPYLGTRNCYRNCASPNSS